jgi:DNA-binding beta-propeller fold protein YncE
VKFSVFEILIQLAFSPASAFFEFAGLPYLSGVFREIGMKVCIAAALVSFAVPALLPVAVLAQHEANFHITRTLSLGGDGSWDYLRFDPDSNRLFIARSTRVMVVDLASGNLIAEINDTPGVHGVALAPELHRGVTSNGKADTASIFYLDSLKIVSNVPTGGKPDGILWEPFTRTVLTMNGLANTISILDVEAAKPLGAIALPGRPEAAVADAKGKVFVNLEDKAQIAEVEMSTRAVLHTWDLVGCTEPTGLAIDLQNSRLFSGCHNGVLVVMDANSGRNIQKLAIGMGVDGVAFDPAIQTVFTSNKEGSISLLGQSGPNSYQNLETVQTLPGAKTLALDPMRHVIYTVANREGQFVLLEIGR